MPFPRDKWEAMQWYYTSYEAGRKDGLAGRHTSGHLDMYGYNAGHIKGSIERRLEDISPINPLKKIY